jgi:3-mercaptopyruvate sulfurtransferase SseA
MAHIPGAISIPLPEAQRDDKRLKDARLIIVYALDWEDPIAMAMSKKLMALGYKDVQTYRGGLREWVTKDRETEPPIEVPKEDAN